MMRLLTTVTVFLIFSLAETQAECNSSRIFQAMNGCHTQRLMLSNASEAVENNYSQLCNAFLNYMKCIEPRIARCEGSALLGFNIIKKTYTRDPYYCPGTSQPESTPRIILEEHQPPRKSLASSNGITPSLRSAVIQAILLYFHHLVLKIHFP